MVPAARGVPLNQPVKKHSARISSTSNAYKLSVQSELFEDAIQIVIADIFNCEFAAFCSVLYLHIGTQMFFQAFFKISDSRQFRGA